MEQQGLSSVAQGADSKVLEKKRKVLKIDVDYVTSRLEVVNGRMYWKMRDELTPYHKTWNARYPGKPADNKVDKMNYRLVMIDGVYYKAHRIVWAICKQQDPGVMDIDHINTIKNDNRIENLRLADCSQNKWNKGLSSNNTSGYKGVSWFKREKRWVAQIWVRGKKKVIGYFNTPEDAHKAYAKASSSLHGEFGRVK